MTQELFECYHCGEKAVGQTGDFTFEDYFKEGDGLIHELRCGNCGAKIIYEIPDRVCSICGKAMSGGYCIGDGEEYFCSDECLRKQYTEEAYREMYRDNMAYWTE